MSKSIVFLCSGGGGNLRFIDAAARRGWLGDALVTAVIADRECGAVEFARQANIQTFLADFSCSGQLSLVSALKELMPSVIVTNVHKILTRELVQEFQGKLVNLHYSLLPAFSGLIGVRPIQQALACGVKFVGVTAHYVDEDVDAGCPISQSAIPVDPEDNEEKIMDVVFRCGCISLLSGLRKILSIEGSGDQLCVVSGRNVLFNPGPKVHDDIFAEAFWNGIKVCQ